MIPTRYSGNQRERDFRKTDNFEIAEQTFYQAGEGCFVLPFYTEQMTKDYRGHKQAYSVIDRRFRDRLVTAS